MSSTELKQHRRGHNAAALVDIRSALAACASQQPSTNPDPEPVVDLLPVSGQEPDGVVWR